MQIAPPSSGSNLAFVQLPGRMRRALNRFRKITGLTAVTRLATSLPEPGTAVALSPPVHPQCAGRLRSVRIAPCGEQWLIHLRSSRRSPRAHRHICPLGMRCSCVPIHFGGQLVGVAKLVADPATSEPAFSAAVGVLKLVVSETCQDSIVSPLSEEVRTLRQRVAGFQQVQARGISGAASSDPPTDPPRRG